MFLAFESELRTRFPRLDGRIFADAVERGSIVPSVVVFLLSGGVDHYRDIDLPSGQFGRVQVDCCADARPAALAMANQIRQHFITINNLGLYVLGASDPLCTCPVQIDRVETGAPRFLSRPPGSRIFTVSFDVVLYYVENQQLVEVI